MSLRFIAYLWLLHVGEERSSLPPRYGEILDESDGFSATRSFIMDTGLALESESSNRNPWP
jgi:hypothetical protein